MKEEPRMAEVEKIVRTIFAFYQSELSLTALLLFTRLLRAEQHPHQGALANLHGFQSKEIISHLAKFRTELRRRKIEQERELQFERQYQTAKPLRTEAMKRHPEIGKQNAEVWKKLEAKSAKMISNNRFAAARFTPEQRAQYERDFGKSA